MIKFLIILFSFSYSYFDAYEKISDYNIFRGDPHNLITNKEFTPYKLITPLFSDYSWKHRTIYIPSGNNVIYNNKDVFEFPVGTIISKTFYYPKDFNDIEKGISLKETRIMIHQPSGWIGLPYVWNEDETEAYLEITGAIKKAEWVGHDGKKNAIDYIVPNMVQCKGCHVDKFMNFSPIGPKARNINSNYNYDGNEIKNQLDKWKELGYFKYLPDKKEIPKVGKWDDDSEDLNKRARSWLDINCAHCHNENGPANNTGLFLEYEQNDEKKIGFYKTPVAAGRGSGHLKYDIYPGYPEKSIMIYRFESTDPGIMMPELGRSMVHQEGLMLIKEWISNLR